MLLQVTKSFISSRCDFQPAECDTVNIMEWLQSAFKLCQRTHADRCCSWSVAVRIHIQL